MKGIGNGVDCRSGLGLLLGLIGVGVALGSSGCQEGEATGGSNFTTSEVKRTDVRITASANGQIEPLEMVEVKSKASGEVTALHVESGQFVEKGTLLLEIDPRDVRTEYDQALADFNVAKVRREMAQKQYERNQTLQESGAVTAQDIENFEIEKANTESAYQRAKSALDLAELRLNDVRITAPMDGTILTDSIKPGTVISSAAGNISGGGTTLLLMADLSTVKVKTFVDETDMGEIQVGMEATVTVEAYKDREFQGAVQKIEPQALNISNVTMFAVIIFLDNAEGLLKPRMNAEVEMLIAERSNTLAAAATALVNQEQAVPAAIVLGMEEDDAQIDPSVWAALQTQAQAAQGGGGAGAGGMADIWAKVRSGEITQDSAMALMRAAGGGQGRGGGGQRGGGAMRGGGQRGGGQGGGAMRGGGGMRGGMGGMMRNRRIAFVLNADSTFEVRPVIIGLSDYEAVEILAGLKEGEQLAIVSALQLKAEQQARLARWTSRRRGLF